MALTQRRRRTDGEAKKCIVRLALTLLLVAATGSQSVSGAQVVRRANDNGIAASREDSLLRQGVLRSLQEDGETPSPAGDGDTPSPVEGEDDDGDVETPSPESDGTPSPAESEGTPSPAESEGTPSPVASEGTPSPVASEGTPSPVASEGTPSPGGSEGAPSPAESEGTPSPAESEGTPDTPAPVEGEGDDADTPSPSESESDGTSSPESGGTPSPAESSETPSPAESGGTLPPSESGGTLPPSESGGTPSPSEGGGTLSPAESDGTPSPAVSYTDEGTLQPSGSTSITSYTEPEPTGTPAPFAPSMCPINIPGVSDGSVCCKEECGQCGGVGCGDIAGTAGASDCCPSTIIANSNGEFCGEAPCVMDGFTPSPVNPAFEGTAAPFEPSMCSNGIPGQQDGSVCCAENCGTCGGAGCGTIPGTGGSAFCCPTQILAAGVVCGEAPCIIENFTPAPAVVGGGTLAPFGNSTCTNSMVGYQNGAVCCAGNCGQCGGEGCGSIPGTAGSSDCCSSAIEVEGELCSLAGEPPCIIDGYTPAPVVPDIGTAAPFAPSMCSNGLAGYQNNDICCLEACGICGGDGCGTIPGTGGSDSCCPSTIREAGVFCGDGVVAPCIIGGFTPSPVNPAFLGTAAPVEQSTCSNGLPGVQNGAACCKEFCGQCGGVGCGVIPGTNGSENCCASTVLESNLLCGNGVEAPCVIENYTPAPAGVPGEVAPFAASTCTNGFAGVQNDNICCAENCGQCGGAGCGSINGTGGSGACCAGTIAVNGTDCAVAMEAPCIIADFVVTPAPTVFMSAAPFAPSTCSNGLDGYQDGQVCCAMRCGLCGGVGCGDVIGTTGAAECCPSTIITSNQTCGAGVVAPCVIPLTPAPSPAPVTVTATPVLAGDADDLVNSTSAAEPGTLRAPVRIFMPLATAAAAFLGALAFTAHRSA
ncbi:unnamed protein product [Pylaiella littoralis]